MAAICNVPVALRVSAVKRTRATRGMSVKAAAGPNHWLPGTEPPLTSTAPWPATTVRLAIHARG